VGLHLRGLEFSTDASLLAPSSRASSSPLDKLESSPPPATIKPTVSSKSRRGKAQVIEEDEDDAALPAEDEEGATSAEEPVEEEGEDLDEDLGEVNTKVAAKKYTLTTSSNKFDSDTCIVSANAAMSKIDEVDLPNGWKTGEP
jgi:hypothetical protein